MANTISGRNILHNWDFRNPVNPRGQSIYNTGYTIDRWVCRTAASNVQLYPDIGLSASDGLVQMLDASISKYLEGKIITLSVLWADGELNSWTAKMQPLSYGQWTIYAPLPNALVGIISYGGTVHQIHFRGDSSRKVQAMKLELGSVSTLANAPPMDYGRELAICQRYQFVAMAAHRVRADFITSTQLGFFIPTPVSLRINPVLPTSLVVATLATVGQTGFTFTAESTGNGIYVAATKAAHGLTDAFLLIPKGAIFDANL